MNKWQKIDVLPDGYEPYERRTPVVAPPLLADLTEQNIMTTNIKTTGGVFVFTRRLSGDGNCGPPYLVSGPFLTISGTSNGLEAP